MFWTGLTAQGQLPEEAGRMEAKNRELRKELEQLNDPRGQHILLLRYACRWPFKEIAKAINYGYSQTRRLHDQAIERYATIMSANEQK